MSDGNKQALIEAGIPASFHDPKLKIADWPKGETIKQWLSDKTAVTDVRNGRGFAVQTEKAKGRELFFMIARALVLHKFSVKVIPLPTLIERLHKRSTDLEPNELSLHDQLADVSCLFVPGFYDSAYTTAFGGDKLSGVEWFLNQRVFNNRPVFPLVNVPLDKCAWWSKSFREVLADKNQTILV